MAIDATKDAAEDALARDIRLLAPDESRRETLSVDDRVLARVTDGIYRQPSSALRELISNAYDADATSVIVRTDAPRFDRIVIQDNGRGMSPEVLAYLIKHIGGSSKRTQRGKHLGTVNDENVLISQSGRKLIGKIGIGMFAVSQLTQHFQIITKQEHDDFYTSAVVVLETHSEELLAESNGEFKTGEVLITRIPTSDVNAHGTDIVLMNIRKSAKDVLGSTDRWIALEESNNGNNMEGFLGNEIAPMYHIGRISPDNTGDLILQPNLPWEDQDAPLHRFKKLYNAIANEVGKTIANPTTSVVLDNYLKMIWDISLAVPVEYMDKHPFNITSADGVDLYQISNGKQRGQAQPLLLIEGATVAAFFNMDSNTPDPAGGFKVIIDDIELVHPIIIDPTLRCRGRGKSSYKQPLLFVGKCITPFSQVESKRGGGALEFEAYIYINQTIVPKENNGVLIRVNRASGTLFDETFMDYRVSELTRLKQMMVEVFVTKGLDPALNIDRESFNSSHPHYQFIKDWIHRAIRQATNRLKAMNKEVLDAQKDTLNHIHRTTLATHVDTVWERLHGSNSFPPDVELVEQAELTTVAKRRDGSLIIEYAIKPPANTIPYARTQDVETHLLQVKALAGILAAYGLADSMPYHRLESLIRDIDAIYQQGGG